MQKLLIITLSLVLKKLLAKLVESGEKHTLELLKNLRKEGVIFSFENNTLVLKAFLVPITKSMTLEFIKKIVESYKKMNDVSISKSELSEAEKINV